MEKNFLGPSDWPTSFQLHKGTFRYASAQAETWAVLADLPLARLPAAHLDGVVRDLGAAVAPGRVPLEVDAVDVPVDVAHVLRGIGEAYAVRSHRVRIEV